VSEPELDGRAAAALKLLAVVDILSIACRALLGIFGRRKADRQT
jgi:hypothetical protein